MRLFRLLYVGLGLMLGLGACSPQLVSFNSKPEASAIQNRLSDTLTTARDTVGSPSLVAKRVTLTKEQEKQAKESEKTAQRKTKKKKKNIFLGERIKRGYTKSGPKGKNQVIEVFYYLKTFQQPNAYAPARYYFNPRKKKIFKATTELDPAVDKVLHGPYKKMQGGKVVETGYYAVGTRHLRWERFNKDNILLSKVHYEMGFPRDAAITYYDGEQKLIKEVIPYLNGKLEGDYVRYLDNGQRDWDGQFENGKKVGEWTKYWGFRNRRHYVYQYGETGYDPEVATPELIKEYNRNAVLIFEKDKLDNRGKPDNSRPGARN
ncbi:hypothetical protein LRS06_08515 [Hymenobacter sp. J193]|uniref:toxin-antitoxin system YwqK family antitoxin n=1 Tax=Hymenobacter sp. J193 TaxID=2898429 RepID=UPI002151578B|nr:hypothetical protein [Hymenobacter sp. J193]MCR5887820.1 hypothetical protein [Hymenobacter sp. J193]